MSEKIQPKLVTEEEAARDLDVTLPVLRELRSNEKEDV